MDPPTTQHPPCHVSEAVRAPRVLHDEYASGGCDARVVVRDGAMVARVRQVHLQKVFAHRVSPASAVVQDAVEEAPLPRTLVQMRPRALRPELVLGPVATRAASRALTRRGRRARGACGDYRR